MVWAGLGAALGVCMSGLLDGNAVLAQSFDNPGRDAAPCIVLNSYEVEGPGDAAGSEGAFTASASIENICARTMQVSFCFLYAASADEREQSCFEGPVRPWATARIEHPDAPARITGTDYRWRYLEPSW